MNARLLLAGLVLATTSCALAQNPPAGPPDGNLPAPVVRSGPGGHDRYDDKGGKGGRGFKGDKGRRGGFDNHDMHGGADRLLPPGTWWRNPEVISRIGLSEEQQKHIDSIFLESRAQLIHMHASLEEEELRLQPLLDVNPVDQGQALAQISKIADTRADLEKANAKMLLGIRAVLSAEQWTKLQAQHPGHHDGGGDRRGPDGRGGHRGPMGGAGGPQGPPPGL